MEDLSFENYWALFCPDAEFGNRRAATQLQWEHCSQKKKQAIITWLSANKPKTSRNPYFFVLDFREPKQQEMSYADYFRRYNTTEERDGWHRKYLPEEQRTIYIKS